LKWHSLFQFLQFSFELCFVNVYHFRYWSLIKIWFGIKNLTLRVQSKVYENCKMCPWMFVGEVSCCGRSILSISRKRNFIDDRSFRSRSGMLLKKGDAVARQRSLAESLAACELDSAARLWLRKRDILVNCYKFH